MTLSRTEPSIQETRFRTPELYHFTVPSTSIELSRRRFTSSSDEDSGELLHHLPAQEAGGHPSGLPLTALLRCRAPLNEVVKRLGATA